MSVRAADLIRRHLHPLQSRLRSRGAEEIVARLGNRLPARFEASSEFDALQVLLPLVQSVVESAESEARLLEENFAAFTSEFLKLDGDAERKRRIRRWLEETVTDRKRLKGDLAAVERSLGFEVLEERKDAEWHRRVVLGELGMTFLGRAAEAVLSARDTDKAAVAETLLASQRLGEFLDARFQAGERWQNRLAAIESLARLYRPLALAGILRHEADTLVMSAMRCAADEDEHPWVQGGALQLLLMISPKLGVEALERRLAASDAPPNPRDFLVRRIAVDLAAQLPEETGREVLEHLVRARDPSEHVRMGLCEAVATLSGARGLGLLRPLAGLDPKTPETSAAVRASALIAARHVASVECATPLADAEDKPTSEIVGVMDVKPLARAAARADKTITLEIPRHPRLRTPVPASTRIPEALGMMAEILDHDANPLVLETACEEISLLAIELSRSDRDEILHAAAPRLISALLRLRARGDRTAAVHEAASAAAEAIDRETSDERSALTRLLREEFRRIVPGQHGAIPQALLDAPLGQDPLQLGRILADLTRRDWGLSIRSEAASLRVWRGEHFRARLWRIVHEIRSPAPNKRQGIAHTLGRIFPGELRAPPGQLEEITSTVVPGERVFIDVEGSWGRHLPTVDDLLDPIHLAPRPVRIFSSHGMTTLLPPAGSFQERLRTHAQISMRYATLASARLASLAAVEPRERRAWLERIEADFGFRASFTPYPFRDIAAEAVTVSPFLRALFPVESADAARRAS